MVKKDEKKKKLRGSPYEGKGMSSRTKGIFNRFFKEHERKSALPEPTKEDKEKMGYRSEYAGSKWIVMRDKATPLEMIQELIQDLDSRERQKRISSALTLVDVVVKERPEDPKTQEVIKELSLIVVRDNGLDILIERHRKKMLRAIAQFHPNPEVQEKAKEALGKMAETAAAIGKIKNLLAA